MNYCSECGFKLDGEFKFCPNCGSNISSENRTVQESAKITEDVITCKNCGEENPLQNEVCFSCGVKLGNGKNIKQVNKQAYHRKNIGARKSPGGNEKTVKEDKVLDNKKIMIYSLTIVAVFIFALVASGVFDTGIKDNITFSPVNEQSTSSGIDLGNMDEINKFEEKVKSNPEDMDATLHLSHILQDSGFYEKAITNYRKYLSVHPENADARVDMAICYYNINDYDNAITEMETAIKYQPSHQLAYLNLGIVNLAAQNVDASKTWFKKTIELDQNSEAGKRAKELLNSH